MELRKHIDSLTEEDYPQILPILLQRVSSLKNEEERLSWLPTISLISKRYQNMLGSRLALPKQEHVQCLGMMGKIKAECLRNTADN
jgi:hypothetical protein